MSDESKIPDTASKKLVRILDNIIRAVSEEDPNVFLAELVLFRVLNKNECSLVDAIGLNTRKFVEMFSLLQSKSAKFVLDPLQKICIKLKWRPLLDLIQSNLRSEKMEELIVPDNELEKHHIILKHGIQTMQQMLFVGRNGYLTKIHDLIENYKETGEKQSKLVKIVVTGLGGVGKTQLVIQFVVRYQLEYDSIIWINAESYNASVTSFTNLGQRLGTYNENMGVRTNVEAIYGLLSSRYAKNLIIFDNADDFIPSEFWVDNLDNFVLIITSRNRQWPLLENKVDVAVFPHTEAVEFVKKSLSEDNYDSPVEIDNLVKELQFFPLALQQAVAYIKQNHTESTILSSRFTVNDYLGEYVTERKTLLNFKFRFENNELNFVTTFNTWLVTVKKLRGLMYTEKFNKEDFPETLQLKILHLICFLNGEQIDPMYFFEVAKQNEKHLRWSVVRLEQYSMVNKVTIGEEKQRTFINIHKLVQEITRIRLQDADQEVQTFDVICRLIISQSPERNNDSLDDMAKLKELMPHFISLKQMLDSISYLDEGFFIRRKILDNMAHCSIYVGNLTLRKNCLLEILLIEHRLHGYGTEAVASLLSITGITILELRHPKIAQILLRQSLSLHVKFKSSPDELAVTSAYLAKTYAHTGNDKMYKQLLAKCISEQNQCTTSDDTIFSHNLISAAAYGALGDTQAEKLCLENALESAERRYGAKHPDLAVTLVELAKANGKLGNYERQLTLLERAKGIQEIHFGPESIQVATTLFFLAIAVGELGDQKRKKMLAEQCLKIREHHFGSEHIDVAEVLLILASAYDKLGEVQQEIDFTKQALPIFEKYYDLMHIRVGTVVRRLGLAYLKEGDLVKGKALLERGLIIMEKASSMDDIADILTSLSSVYGKMFEHETAVTFLEKALKIRQNIYGTKSAELLPTIGSLEMAHRKLGNNTIADTYLQQSLIIQEEPAEKLDLNTTTANYLNEMSVNNLTPETLKKVLLSLKQSRPANDPLILQCLELLADLYASKGDILKQTEVLFEYYLLQYPTGT